MFDLGWQEFILIALVAVVVVGPKDLPRVIRTVGQWIRKARSLASEFQGSLEEMAREAELDDVRKQIQQVSKDGIGASIGKHVDPTGELRESFEEAKNATGADEIETALDETRRDLGSIASGGHPTPSIEPAAGVAPDDSATPSPASAVATSAAATSAVATAAAIVAAPASAEPAKPARKPAAKRAAKPAAKTSPAKTSPAKPDAAESAAAKATAKPRRAARKPAATGDGEG